MQTGAAHRDRQRDRQTDRQMTHTQKDTHSQTDIETDNTDTQGHTDRPAHKTLVTAGTR